MLDGEKIVGEEKLLKDLRERIRDVRKGPDGAIWLLTDNPEGRVLRWCQGAERCHPGLMPGDKPRDDSAKASFGPAPLLLTSAASSNTLPANSDGP